MLDAHSSDIVIAGTDIAFRSVNIRQEIALITVEIVVHIFPDLGSDKGRISSSPDPCNCKYIESSVFRK